MPEASGRRLLQTSRGASALAETDLADAVVEVGGAFEDFDFDAHEENAEVASIQFGETDRVFLSRDDQVGLAFLAAVDDVENFLLRKAVMIGEAFGVNEFATEPDQT